MENLKKANGPDYFEKLKIQNPAFSDPIASGY